jgi:signal transduction histidine kinase
MLDANVGGAGGRLFEALRPLVQRLGPEAAEQFLPDLVRDVSGGDGAAIALFEPNGRSIDRVLDSELAEPAHTVLASQTIAQHGADLPPAPAVIESTATLADGEPVDVLLARLVVDDEGGGVVCTVIRSSRGFSKVDAEAFSMLLPWLGAVLSRGEALGSRDHVARLLEDRLRRELLTTERERQRWARNLHDETLQAMGVLRFGLAAALESPSNGDRRALSGAVDSLARQIDSLRGLIDDLRPSVLDQMGLGPALHALVDRTRRDTGIRVDLRIALGEDEDRLPDGIELMVYRLVQEALNNTVKHAQASSVRVAVALRQGDLEILVADDGRGFDALMTKRRSGLAGMAERVALAQGRLEIRSRVGTGTTIEVELPL